MSDDDPFVSAQQDPPLSPVQSADGFSSSPIRLDLPPSPHRLTEEQEDNHFHRVSVHERTDELSSPIRFTQTSPMSSPTRARRPDDDMADSADAEARARSRSRRRLAHFQQDSPSSMPGLPSDADQDMPPPAENTDANDAAPQKAVIWGTDIDVNDLSARFVEFLQMWPDEDTGLPLYGALLEQMARTAASSLNINCSYIKTFDNTLYRQLCEYPSEVLAIMDANVQTALVDTYEQLKLADEDSVPEDPPLKPNVRPFGLETLSPLRSLDPTNINQLVAVCGMVIRVSPVIPEMKQAFHRCALCQNSATSEIEAGIVTAPPSCSRCHTVGSMELIHNRCTFTDKQIIKLQETPDAMPDGDTPHTVSLMAYGDLVDVGRPGDRVEVTGVFRAVPTRASSKMRTVKSIYKTYIDVVHFKKTDKRRMADTNEDDGGRDSLYFDENGQSTGNDDVARVEGDETDALLSARRAEMEELASRDDIYDLLVRSLAPSIWQLDDVKKGILCLLFGGTNKDFTAQGVGRTRGDINILLCGDPGTSKSQLLSYVHKLAPRGIYTSGKGSSAVGLTAYIARDPDTGESMLESGALVLSDRGVCCIDEFDKMSDTTRAVLHEVMEQQTVSVAKAGIVCTLNARTSILASANPIESRYNPNRSVVENLDLPPTLLSRFDLIYLVLDKADEANDRRLARHLVQLYWQDPPETRDILPIETMTRYISHARRHCHPVISPDAATALVRRYTAMRRLGASQRTVSATPRQLESLIRLSEAIARMRLSNTVEANDVSEAARLLSSAMQTAAIDPRTGRVDMDLINTGRSAAQRTRVDELVGELRRFLQQRPSIKFQQLLVLMQQQSSVEVTPDDLRDALRQLVDVDFVSMAGDPRNETIRVLRS